MGKKLGVVFFLLFFSVAWVGSAGWAETRNLVHEEEQTMEVSATAIDEVYARQIHLETAKRNLATDMKDVFKMDSSVEIGGGSRAAQRIYVRGIEASNLNVTIDGASKGMNQFQHRGNIGGINPEMLKRVEVQTMPTADQGPGALGGSIRFETVDAQDLLDKDKKGGAIMRGGYSSVDEGDTLGGAVFGRFGAHVGLLFDYSETDFDEYEDGDGNEIVGSEGEDSNMFFKMSVLDLNGHSLRFSVENHEDEGLYTGDWTYGDGTARTPSHQVSERDTYIFDHRFVSQNTKLIDWRFNAYRNEETLDRSGSETTSEGDGFDMRNTARFELGPTHHALTFGFDWSTEEGEEEGDPTDVDIENTGLYVQNRMTISRLMLSFGARFDDYDTTFGDVDISGDEVSPNVGAEVNIGMGFDLFASYGEAVRAKGVIPIGWLVDIVEDPEINQQEGKKSYGKSMEPESSTTYEYGIRHRSESLFTSGDRVNAQLTLFDTEIEDLIMEVGGRRGLPVTGLYNDDLVTTEGYEVKLGWGLGGFDTSLSYTHADTEDEDGNAIAFSRRRAASSGDTLVWNSFWQMNAHLGLGYTFKYVEDLDRDEVDRDGYVLHNAQVRWSPQIIPGVTVTLAALNIFDEEYSSQASSGEDDTATPEPGRDIRIGVKYKVMF